MRRENMGFVVVVIIVIVIVIAVLISSAKKEEESRQNDLQIAIVSDYVAKGMSYDDATYCMLMDLLSGKNGLKQDYVGAGIRLKRLADKGHVEAMLTYRRM